MAIMRLVDRLSKLETRGGDGADRRRAIEADAAEFVSRMSALADRTTTSVTTAEFAESIGRSGDPFLITTFLGERYAHS